jgi:hypothetical protein
LLRLTRIFNDKNIRNTLFSWQKKDTTINKHRRGELWFGIQPNGKATGLDVTEKTLRDLSQAIAAHIEPRIYMGTWHAADY